MNQQFTHLGIIEPFSGASLIKPHPVKLRELKTYWLSQYRLKYDKHRGFPLKEKWPTCRLNLSTIKPIVTV